MENDALLRLLEQEYLQEYEHIKQQLLARVKESSFLQAELHDVANKLYAAQLKKQQPSSIYDGKEEAFLLTIQKKIPQPLHLPQKKDSHSWRILALALVIVVVSIYGIVRIVTMEQQRKMRGYLPNMANVQVYYEEWKDAITYTFDLEQAAANKHQIVYEQDGNTISIFDVEEQADAYLIYLEASGTLDAQGGSLLSLVSHVSSREQTSDELQGRVSVLLEDKVYELPWIYTSVNTSQNKDVCGFRLDKSLVAESSSVELRLEKLIKTVWTHK